MVVVSNVALVFPWGAPYVLTPSYPESTNLPTSHIQFQRRIHSIAPFPTRIKATFLCGMGAIAPMRPFQIWYVECRIFVPPLRNSVWCESFFFPPSHGKRAWHHKFVLGFGSELGHIFVSPIYNTAMCERPLKKKYKLSKFVFVFRPKDIFFRFSN